MSRVSTRERPEPCAPPHRREATTEHAAHVFERPFERSIEVGLSCIAVDGRGLLVELPQSRIFAALKPRCGGEGGVQISERFEATPLGEDVLTLKRKFDETRQERGGTESLERGAHDVRKGQQGRARVETERVRLQRRGFATERPGLFEQRDLAARARELSGGRHSTEAAANHGDATRTGHANTLLVSRIGQCWPPVRRSFVECWPAPAFLRSRCAVKRGAVRMVTACGSGKSSRWC